MTPDREDGLFDEATAIVRRLEDMEDYYFEADKDAKMQEVASAASAAVDRALSGQPRQRHLQVKSLYLKGRIASLRPGQEQDAEALLSKAIKLDPKLLCAWNTLGEVYWNMQSYYKAKDCFEQAMELCGENSVSLRNLSMVLRALDDSEARAENYARALEKAKAAVALDTTDAQNWETLGNAYIGDFFVNARRLDEISRALIAYEKAEAAYERLGKHSPSLQLNRGIAAKYIEDYDLAMRSFQKAHEIGAASGMVERQKVSELVQRVASHVERKSDLKAKHLRELTVDLKSGDSHQTLRDLRTAAPAAGGASAAGAAVAEEPLVARVVAFIDRQAEMPVIVICCDALGEFFALSLYNALSTKVADALVPMKSVLHIQHPKLRRVCMTGLGGKQLAYPCVRVAHPGDVTIRGDGSLGVAASQSEFRAGAGRVEAKDAGVQASWEKSGATCTETEDGQVEKRNPASERWIEQEDAKRKKQEAKAKAKLKSGTKAKRKDRHGDRASKASTKISQKVAAPLDMKEEVQEVEYGSDVDDESTRGSQNSTDNSTKGEQPPKARWADLEVTDSEGEDYAAEHIVRPGLLCQ